MALLTALALSGVAAAQSVTFIHGGDQPTLEAGEGQAIRGQTDLEAGATVTLRVVSENSTSPFLSRPEATVEENGRFTAYVDLSHVEPGSNVTVTVDHDGETLAEMTTELQQCSGGCKPAAAIDEQGERLTLRAGPGQGITGTTSLDSASPVTVRVESKNSGQPFLVAKETLVSNDGSFSTHLDLTDVRPETRVGVSVFHDGDRLTATTGEVIPCDGDCEPVTTETPTPRPTVSADEFGFKSLVEVTESETARIPIGLGDADAATLVVGSPNVNYIVNATVHDGNGDGRVVVEFDTAAAGTDNRTLSVADEADELNVFDPEPDLGTSINPAGYEMRLYEGASTDGDPTSTGTLVVRQSTPTRADELRLEKDVIGTQPNETATIPVGFGDGDAATISIGSDNPDYGLDATVRDGNGDGRVVLLFETRNAGTDRQTLRTAAADDVVTVTDPEPSLDSGLPETEYDIDLYRGSEVRGNPVDIGALAILTSDGTRTAALEDPGSARNGIALGGIGILATGAVLAVIGVGLLLGLFRS